MSKNKSLVNQITTELISQCRFGQSKYKARRDEETRNPEGIFAKKTFVTYRGICRTFGKWAADTHHCRKLSDAKEYAPEYIQLKIDEGLSAWSIHTIVSALAKLFRVNTGDFGVKLPKRERKDIVRSRTPPSAKILTKYHDVFEFVKGCGLRPHETRMVRGEDVYQDDGKVYVVVRNGKGGKKRTVTTLAEYGGHILKMAASVEPGELIFKETPSKGHLHYFRGYFAKALYNRLARPKEDIPKSDRYVMRKDRAGEVLDKKAMLKVSRQLGHNRLDVIAGHYLY